MKIWRVLFWTALFTWLFMLVSVKVHAADFGTEQVLDPTDIIQLAKLVQAEAGNQSFEGKRLVVDVVLNRIDSETFPNSVETVIRQDGQFLVIRNGSFDRAEPSEEDFEAVRMELLVRTNSEVIYFQTGNFSRYGEALFKEGDHYFSRERK